MENINETKKSELKALHRKKRPGLMFQLWGMMMGLVVLTAACMCVSYACDILGRRGYV